MLSGEIALKNNHYSYYYEISMFEDILVLFSLQRLNCILDNCTYVHGLAMLWLC